MKKNYTEQIWNDEYTNPQFTSFERKPHQDVKDFLSFLRRKEKIELEGKIFLDVGCGIGKDLEYAIDHYGMQGIGCDVSPVAITEAKKHIPTANLFVHDLGKVFPVEQNSVDCAIMIMVLHTLSAEARNSVFQEIHRVLKPGGFFLVKTLCLEGDAHAKYLVKNMPGEEENSFIHPDLKIPEYVHTREKLETDVIKYFEIISMDKKTGYQRWDNKSYKRNYWVAYLKKKL